MRDGGGDGSYSSVPVTSRKSRCAGSGWDIGGSGSGYASLVGILLNAVFQAVQVGAGGVNVAAVIIATFGMDVFRQTLQVSLSTKIFRSV